MNLIFEWWVSFFNQGRNLISLICTVNHNVCTSICAQKCIYLKKKSPKKLSQRLSEEGFNPKSSKSYHFRVLSLYNYLV